MTKLNILVARLRDFRKRVELKRQQRDDLNEPAEVRESAKKFFPAGVDAYSIEMFQIADGFVVEVNTIDKVNYRQRDIENWIGKQMDLPVWHTKVVNDGIVRSGDRLRVYTLR